MKHILCTFSQPPYANAHALELIDTAMVGAVFDFSVSLLFRDEGIWSLIPSQNADALQQRTFSKVLAALPSYDIDQIYVCDNSLRERELTPQELVLPCKPLSAPEIAALIARQDAVIGGGV